MKKYIHRLSAAALIGALPLLTTCAKKKSDLQGAVITGVKGQVSVSETQAAGGTAERTVTAAELYTKAGLLTPGMILWTGPDSHADLQFRSGMVMRVTACSKVKLETARIVIDSGFSQVTMNLASGAVFARSDKLQNKSSLSVITPTAVASVRGTEFMVKDGSHCAGGPSGRTETLVQDGSVVVSDPAGLRTESVNAGGKASVDTRGIAVSAMSESDKKEITTAGRDIQPVSGEGRSKLDAVLAVFAENANRFKEAVSASTAPAVTTQSTAKPDTGRQQESSAGIPVTKEPEKKPETKSEPKVETKGETKPTEQPDKNTKKSSDTDNTPML